MARVLKLALQLGVDHAPQVDKMAQVDFETRTTIIHIPTCGLLRMKYLQNLPLGGDVEGSVRFSQGLNRSIRGG